MDFSEIWENSASSVSVACRNGDVESLRTLLETKNPVDRVDNRGYRALHEAARNNHLACVKLLINNGDTDLNWRTFEDETALVVATKRGHEEMVRILLEAKADPNCCTNFKEIALHFAVGTNMLRTVNDLLAAGSDINAADYGNETPLHMAVLKNNFDIVRTLINNNAKIRLKDDFGRNAVFMAAENGSFDILDYLLDQLQTKNSLHLVDASTKDGTTPLMIAAQNGHTACLQLLIDHGADPVRLSLENNSAIELAINQGEFECFEMLFSLVKDHDIAKKCTGSLQCLLHVLVNANRYEPKIFRHLIDNGHRLNWCAPRASSDRAVPQIDFCKMCTASHGYDQTVRVTVLISAMVAKNHSYVNDILEHGGDDLNQPYETLPVNFSHPLSLCSSDPEQAETLLKNGANPNYPLNIEDDACPFILQMHLDNPKFLIKLIKYGGDVGNCFLKCAKGNKMIYVGNNPGHKCLNKIIKCFLGPNYCLVSLRDNGRYYLKLFSKGIPDLKQLECTSLDKSSCVDINFDCMSLRHMCRTVIVRQVLESTKWSVLKNSLPKLQLPVHIINYLLYDDL